MPEVRERYVAVGDRLGNAGLSPNAARAVFEARGEIITVPAEKGDPRNLTNTTGVMERDPAWSPDGKTIAYFSDESGEYMLHLKPQSGAGETVKIALGDEAFVLFLSSVVARFQEDRLQRRPSGRYGMSISPRRSPSSWTRIGIMEGRAARPPGPPIPSGWPMRNA